MADSPEPYLACDSITSTIVDLSGPSTPRRYRCDALPWNRGEETLVFDRVTVTLRIRSPMIQCSPLANVQS